MSDRFNLGSFVEATAFAALDEVFATFHSEDGYARPSRYEAYFFPPISRSQTNVPAQMMVEQIMNGTA